MEYNSPTGDVSGLVGSSQPGQTEFDTYGCDRIISKRDATHFSEIGCNTDSGSDLLGRVSSSYTMRSGPFGTIPGWF